MTRRDLLRQFLVVLLTLVFGDRVVEWLDDGRVDELARELDPGAFDRLLRQLYPAEISGLFYTRPTL